MHHPDICIAGAGIIGLSLALELHQRGLRVTVLDQAAPLAEASTAAAGMLAANDPHNPPQLRPLASLSLSLYPDFLDRLHISLRHPRPLPDPHHPAGPPARRPHAQATNSPPKISPISSPHSPGDHRFILLDEHSLDPRQLAAALLAAVRATTIDLRPNTPVLSTRSSNNAIEVHTPTGILHATHFVDCTGAWASATSHLPNIHVTPKKGQMLAVSLLPRFPCISSSAHRTSI